MHVIQLSLKLKLKTFYHFNLASFGWLYDLSSFSTGHMRNLLGVEVMEHYEEIIETKVLKKYINTTCDICGRDVNEGNTESFFNEVTISHEYGKRWTGCQTASKFEPDICNICFTEKIVPFLKSLGLNVEYVDSSF